MAKYLVEFSMSREFPHTLPSRIFDYLEVEADCEFEAEHAAWAIFRSRVTYCPAFRKRTFNWAVTTEAFYVSGMCLLEVLVWKFNDCVWLWLPTIKM